MQKVIVRRDFLRILYLPQRFASSFQIFTLTLF